jgi:hypothetical protein
VPCYLGVDQASGPVDPQHLPPDELVAMFQAAGFRPMEVVTVPDGRVIMRPVDDLVAQALSSSSTAPHLFGDRLDDFVADLRAALLDAHPSGFAELLLPDNQLRIWRPR